MRPLVMLLAAVLLLFAVTAASAVELPPAPVPEASLNLPPAPINLLLVARPRVVCEGGICRIVTAPARAVAKVAAPAVKVAAKAAAAPVKAVKAVAAKKPVRRVVFRRRFR